MSNYRDDIIEALEVRLLMYPEVVKGRIFGHPGFKIGNRLFCFAYEDGLALKLAREDYQAILESEEAEPFRPGGSSPMGTWAVLTYPDAQDYIEHWEWIEKAMAYIVTDEAAPPKKKIKDKR
jgi:hypothetical protein